MSDELKVGPELDAAMAELMGVEPLSWQVSCREGDALCCSLRQVQELLRNSEVTEYTIRTEHRPYSTTDEWAGKVLDWLVSLGWGYELRGAVDGVAIRLRMESDSREWSKGKPIPPHVDWVSAPTRAEAICRAALKTKGRL